MTNTRSGNTLTLFEATMIAEGCWDMTPYEPDEDVYIDAAQVLIDSGLAWSVQGFFGHTYQALIEKGYCRPAGEAE